MSQGTLKRWRVEPVELVARVVATNPRNMD